jgi:hypothetical protein
MALGTDKLAGPLSGAQNSCRRRLLLVRDAARIIDWFWFPLGFDGATRQQMGDGRLERRDEGGVVVCMQLGGGTVGT